jgi:hypothetical protein
MPKYAVAFVYQQSPWFDRKTFDGTAYHYFLGDVEVMELEHSMGLHLTLELGLDLEFTEATSANEAIKELINRWPYHIVRATAREVK